MKEKASFEKHFAALAAIFLLGDAVIAMPYASSGRQAPAAFLLACAVAALLYGLIFALIKRLYPPHPGAFIQKTAASVLKPAVSVCALFAAAQSFGDFVRFVKTNLLPETPTPAVVVLFLITVACLAWQRQSVLLKFSLISFMVAAAAIVLFFILSSNQFDGNHIRLFRVFPLDDLWEQSFPFWRRLIFPACLLAVYHAVAFREVRPAGALGGLAVGFVLLGLCLLNSILIFGLPFAAKLRYPYASAVSTVSVGQLFTRMDGASYFVYFAGCLIRVTVCVNTVKTLLFSSHESALPNKPPVYRADW